MHRVPDVAYGLSYKRTTQWVLVVNDHLTVLSPTVWRYVYWFLYAADIVGCTTRSSDACSSQMTWRVENSPTQRAHATRGGRNCERLTNASARKRRNERERERERELGWWKWRAGRNGQRIPERKRSERIYYASAFVENLSGRKKRSVPPRSFLQR